MLNHKYSDEGGCNLIQVYENCCYKDGINCYDWISQLMDMLISLDLRKFAELFCVVCK